MRLRQRDGGLGSANQIHTGRQGHVRFARTQAAACQMERDERRRTRRVHRERRAAKAETVREPARGDAGGGARSVVAVNRRVATPQQPLQIIAVALTDEHAGEGVRQLVRRHARVLERLPSHLEQQTLLRVHASRLQRRDAKKAGIESRDVVQEPPGAHCHPPWRIAVGIEQNIRVPTVGGNHPRGRTPLVEQAPKSLGRVRAGKSAAHSDDGDGLMVVCRLEPRLLLQCQQQQMIVRKRSDLFRELRHDSVRSGTVSTALSFDATPSRMADSVSRTAPRSGSMKKCPPGNSRRPKRPLVNSCQALR